MKPFWKKITIHPFRHFTFDQVLCKPFTFENNHWWNISSTGTHTSKDCHMFVTSRSVDNHMLLTSNCNSSSWMMLKWNPTLIFIKYTWWSVANTICVYNILKQIKVVVQCLWFSCHSMPIWLTSLQSKVGVALTEPMADNNTLYLLFLCHNCSYNCSDFPYTFSISYLYTSYWTKTYISYKAGTIYLMEDTWELNFFYHFLKKRDMLFK